MAQVVEGLPSKEKILVQTSVLEKKERKKIHRGTE
jgi:hypothetical protein